MEAILNFIKEALKGKKMSASWIVTLAVAIGGLAWVGAFAYQEYETIKLKITYLEKKAHTKTELTPHYDDSPLSARVTTNAGAIIQLQEYTSGFKGLKEDLSSVTGDIISLQGYTSGLDTIYDDLSQASGSIIILQERMKTQEGNNNDAISHITDMQDEVNTNTNLLTAVKEQIKALEKDVEQTENAVKDKVNPLTM